MTTDRRIVLDRVESTREELRAVFERFEKEMEGKGRPAALIEFGRMRESGEPFLRWAACEQGEEPAEDAWWTIARVDE